MENYDAVLVTLLGDTAQYYVQMRQYQEQIELTKQNVKLQRDVLKIVQARLNAGTASELDVDQQQTTLSQTEAADPGLADPAAAKPGPALHLDGHSAHRSASPLGAAADSHGAQRSGGGHSGGVARSGGPTSAPPSATAAAQAQQIGIAQAALYPHISISGTLGYSAENASQLFTPAAFNGSVGPSFQWNILNYGRIANNVRLQDAKFQQTLLDYRTAVLTANQEAEDGLVDLPAIPRGDEAAHRERGRRRQGLPHRRQPVSRGHGRLQPPRHHRTKPGHSAGFPGPGPRSDRPGPGPGLSGFGRRLGDPSWSGSGSRFAAAASIVTLPLHRPRAGGRDVWPLPRRRTDLPRSTGPVPVGETFGHYARRRTDLPRSTGPVPVGETFGHYR